MLGVKSQRAELLAFALPLSMQWKNARHLSIGGGDRDGLDPFKEPERGGFGGWSGSEHRRLVGQYFAYRDRPPLGMLASRGSGDWRSFEQLSDGSFKANGSQDATLKRIGTQYHLQDLRGAVFELYDSAGVLGKGWLAAGGHRSYTYSSGVVEGESPEAGLLMAVTDHLGRTVRFKYEQGVKEPRVYRIVATDGQEIEVGYEGADNLSALKWPDGKVRRFVYERSDLPWALTGIPPASEYLSPR